MEKYIVTWNAGDGNNFTEVEVNSIEEAEDYAYECWLAEADSHARYSVVGLSTKNLREKCRLNEECE